MILRRTAQPVAVVIVCLMIAPASFGQSVSAPYSQPLKIAVLEGQDSVNSISLLHSVPTSIEVRDENDFPFEGADVEFTLPEQGPGGTFVTGGKTFKTRSDSHGQATAPVLIPQGPGKFQMRVIATAGTRKATAVIAQTNVTGMYSGIEPTRKPWYKRRIVLIVGGAGLAGATVAAIILLKGSSSSPSVSVTPGTPVFH
jgi:hypothetical protein